MYVLYMAISHGIFFKVSIFQYYYIVWKYNIMYVLYMANIFIYNNFIRYVTIYTCIKKGYVREKLNSHKLTYPSTTLYKIQTIYIYTTTRQVSRSTYCVEVQHNVRTLYGYQPWYIFQGVYISILLYCVEVQYNVRTL